MRPAIHFAKRLFEQGAGVYGCEVGVYHGDNAFSIIENWPECHLTLVEIEPNWKQIIETRLKGKENNYTLIIGDSAVVAETHKGELDFVYIDDDHTYNGIEKSSLAWWPKLRVGGVFAGHDFDDPIVAMRVRDFFQEKNIYLYNEESDWWGIKRAE
jgi:predicted O-methyltransferase YrrM